MGRIGVVIATAAYSGYFPIAPGTVGSAVGVVLWWALRSTGVGPAGELALCALLLPIGAWAATLTERHLGVTDPGPVVIDEVLGMWVTLIAAPVTWTAAVTGFVLFRFFDIVKPPPARQLERAHGGWGIMLDDLAAGVYAWAVLAAAGWLVPAWIA